MNVSRRYLNESSTWSLPPNGSQSGTTPAVVDIVEWCQCLSGRELWRDTVTVTLWHYPSSEEEKNTTPILNLSTLQSEYPGALSQLTPSVIAIITHPLLRDSISSISHSHIHTHAHTHAHSHTHTHTPLNTHVRTQTTQYTHTQRETKPHQAGSMCCSVLHNWIDLFGNWVARLNVHMLGL